MPRAKPHETKLKKKYYPLVSICTPTFNRRPFIPTMFECFRNQTYPKDRMEWIIVDDGTDRIRDLVESSGITQIKYFEMPKKVSLGEKRNYMHRRLLPSRTRLSRG
jgi:glycosyltransferase involved in cell wall biosynthesis